MTQPSELVATFLAHTGGRLEASAEADALEGLLRRVWEDARAQWPEVELPAERFIRHLAERLPEAGSDGQIGPRLEQLSLPELYLACACVQGIAEATVAFDRHYLSRLPGLLGYLRQPAAIIDEVCQLTRVKLLVHTPEGAPRLNDYTGQGSLLSWVRITAVRIALRVCGLDKPAPDEGVVEVLESLPAPGDVELDLIRRRHHAEFRQAVREAFAALSMDERHLLRLHVVDQLSTVELGALFRVNQSTVSRWLKSVRQTVFNETRRRLQARLGLSARDFQSFLGALDSQLELGISLIFGEEDAQARK
ncbi:sigma-70 family RNA polymerase sigma factor [Archangium violaceum]|uniref:sigma-70 family RNA polymerase sigma factor n=1 Tax=Archangium violaceum TaxID=83451 RepID=UPI0019503C8F|nr:sigma-70 family RNA polymerase sigma factor [Archangium violaceum]QRN99234.1 sigma-70 family RNA polymerase sigma factor [Archangium violaceum]